MLLVVGCKLGEIATKRFTIPRQGQDRHPPRHRAGGVRPHLSSPRVALWGDVREGIRDLAAALAGDAERLASERRDYAAERGRAHGQAGGPASWSA